MSILRVNKIEGLGDPDVVQMETLQLNKIEGLADEDVVQFPTGVPGEYIQDLFDEGYDITIRPGDIVTKGPWIDARAYGTPGEQTTLQAAILDIDTDERTLYIAPGIWSITSNFEIKSNIHLKIERGAIFAIAPGITLTINGFLDAGPYQIFICLEDGMVVLGASASIQAYANWWGLTGDGSTDNYAAIQAAMKDDSGVADGGTLRFVSDQDRGTVAKYAFDSEIESTKSLHIISDPIYVELHYTQLTGDAFTWPIKGDMAWLHLENIKLISDNTSNTGKGFNLIGCNYYKVEGCDVSYFKYPICIDGGAGWETAEGGSYYGLTERSAFLCNSLTGAAAILCTGEYWVGNSHHRPNHHVIFRCGASGAAIDGYGIRLEYGAGWTIEDCSLEGNLGWSIYIYKSGYHRIIHNWFDNGASTIGAWYADADSIGCYFSGNLYRSGTDAKWIDLGIGNRMEDTYIQSTGEIHRYGIGANNIPQNLVTFGAFPVEHYGVYSVTTPLGWIPAEVTGATFAMDSTDYVVGRNSFKIVNTSGNQPRIYQIFSVPKPGFYTLSGWTKSSAVYGSTVYIGTRGDPDSGGSIYNRYVNEWEFSSYTFATPPNLPTQTGSGLSNLTCLGGIYDTRVYTITISSTGAVDKFTWNNGGDESAEISMTGAIQTIEGPFKIKWTTITGHTLGDSWTTSASTEIRVTCFNYSVTPASPVTARFSGIMVVPGNMSYSWHPHPNDLRPVISLTNTVSTNSITDMTPLYYFKFPGDLLRATGAIELMCVGRCAGTTPTLGGISGIYIGDPDEALSTYTMLTSGDVTDAYDWQISGKVINSSETAQKSSFTGIQGSSPISFITSIDNIRGSSAIDTKEDFQIVVCGKVYNAANSIKAELGVCSVLPAT